MFKRCRAIVESAVCTVPPATTTPRSSNADWITCAALIEKFHELLVGIRPPSLSLYRKYALWPETFSQGLWRLDTWLFQSPCLGDNPAKGCGLRRRGAENRGASYILNPLAQ